jgi:23S rRNA pseudouridine2605 synthase
VFDAMPPELPRVVSIGRLDINSEGLLLLTTDGELARTMEHPDNGWIRRYRVRIHGRPTADAFKKLERGVTIDGVRYGPIKVEIDRQQGANAWLTMSLTEGKNREIRRVLAHLGYEVSRLMRTAYGPFQLGGLKLGEIREIPGKTLREQLGDEAGAKILRKSPSSAGLKSLSSAATKIPPRQKKPASALRLRDKSSDQKRH